MKEESGYIKPVTSSSKRHNASIISQCLLSLNSIFINQEIQRPLSKEHSCTIYSTKNMHSFRTISSLFLAALGIQLAAAQTPATFTEYGSGDDNGSANCATTVNACGTPSAGYTAAISQAQFGAGPGEGAGPACGTCWQLTINTDTAGNPVEQRTVTVTVNNLCPIDGNEQFCNVPNQYGGQVHFDLCIDSGAAGAFFTSTGSGIGSAVEVSCA